MQPSEPPSSDWRAIGNGVMTLLAVNRTSIADLPHDTAQWVAISSTASAAGSRRDTPHDYMRHGTPTLFALEIATGNNANSSVRKARAAQLIS
jgi:hypothetical protein